MPDLPFARLLPIRTSPVGVSRNFWTVHRGSEQIGFIRREGSLRLGQRVKYVAMTNDGFEGNAIGDADSVSGARKLFEVG